MASKLRIKVGTLEIDYEGSEEFNKADLLALLEALHKIRAESGSDLADVEQGDSDKVVKQTGDTLSTSTVAQRLGADSGPLLALAAMAKLIISAGAESATRKQILAEMKLAKSFYKSSYGSNLGNTLKRLVQDGALHEVGTNNYSLNEKKRDELRKKLAQ